MVQPLGFWTDQSLFYSKNEEYKVTLTVNSKNNGVFIEIYSIKVKILNKYSILRNNRDIYVNKNTKMNVE